MECIGKSTTNMALLLLRPSLLWNIDSIWIMDW